MIAIDVKCLNVKNSELFCYRREIAILCGDKSEMQALAEKFKTLNSTLTQK